MNQPHKTQSVRQFSFNFKNIWKCKIVRLLRGLYCQKQTFSFSNCFKFKEKAAKIDFLRNLLF